MLIGNGNVFGAMPVSDWLPHRLGRPFQLVLEDIDDNPSCQFLFEIYERVVGGFVEPVDAVGKVQAFQMLPDLVAVNGEILSTEQQVQCVEGGLGEIHPVLQFEHAEHAAHGCHWILEISSGNFGIEYVTGGGPLFVAKF